MGYLGATLTQVFTRAWAEWTCHSKMGNGATECRWRHISEDLGDFESQLVELRTRHRTRRVVFQGSQRPDEFVRTGATRNGGRWKSHHRKIVHLKGNKRFCTWTKKSLGVFSCFGIPMFYVYMLWTFYVHFNIHVWLCFNSTC